MLGGLAMTPFGPAVAAAESTMRAPSPERLLQLQRRADAAVALPYERITAPGSEALTIFGQLRLDGRGWPIVVGGDEDLGRVAEKALFAGKSLAEMLQAAEAILDAANPIVHPRDILAAQEAEARAEFEEAGRSSNSRLLN